MGKVVFCNDEQTRGVLIYAVYYARPLLTADARERVAAIVHQRVDQRTVLMTGSRMHHHAARLVDNNHIAVLKNDIQRNILRRKLCVLDLGGRKLNNIARNAFVVFLNGFAVYADLAAVKQLLRRGACKFRNTARKESVDALAALLHGKFYNIIHQSPLNSAKIDSRS